jgi:hypothetical protein
VWWIPLPLKLCSRGKHTNQEFLITYRQQRHLYREQTNLINERETTDNSPFLLISAEHRNSLKSKRDRFNSECTIKINEQDLDKSPRREERSNITMESEVLLRKGLGNVGNGMDKDRISVSTRNLFGKSKENSAVSISSHYEMLKQKEEKSKIKIRHVFTTRTGQRERDCSKNGIGKERGRS